MSRATSGEPCFGLTSMLNGEKPQSSVEPSRSFGYVLCRQDQVAAHFSARLRHRSELAERESEVDGESKGRGHEGIALIAPDRSAIAEAAKR
jgi:hypothetical protein